MIIPLKQPARLPQIKDLFDGKDGKDTKEFIKKLIKAINKLGYKDCADRKHCYIVVYDKLSTELRGSFFTNGEEAEYNYKYLCCATEKVTRVVKYNLQNSFGMITDPTKEFGGGVNFNSQLYIACSGFPPEIDEAVSYLIGLFQIGTSYVGHKERVATKNEFVTELWYAVKYAT